MGALCKFAPWFLILAIMCNLSLTTSSARGMVTTLLQFALSPLFHLIHSFHSAWNECQNLKASPCSTSPFFPLLKADTIFMAIKCQIKFPIFWESVSGLFLFLKESILVTISSQKWVKRFHALLRVRTVTRTTCQPSTRYKNRFNEWMLAEWMAQNVLYYSLSGRWNPTSRESSIFKRAQIESFLLKSCFLNDWCHYSSPEFT